MDDTTIETVRFHNHGMIGAWLIGEEEARECGEVIASRSLFRHYGIDLLHKALRFEEEICGVLGTSHALAVNSGTSALRCALTAMNIAPGDEVIVPACTFVATANAVALAGGVPVFAEIDDSLGLDPDLLYQRISSRTVGIMPVHLQGVGCRIDAIMEFARPHGLWVVEDAAQGFGVSIGGRHAGTFGDAGVFSLQAHKTITCGEGGVMVTGDEDIYRRARRYQDQGGERDGDDYPSWECEESGFGENLKMSELHAAVALAQLRKLSVLREAMQRAHGRLAERVDLRGRGLRYDPSGDGSIPYGLIFFAHDVADRDRIFALLEEREIPRDGLYSDPVYRLRPYQRWARGERVAGLPQLGLRPEFTPCPRSEQLMERIVRIPLSPAYTDHDVDMLAEAINAALAEAEVGR